MTAAPAYDALVAHHRRLHHFWHLQAMASWDRLTQMPSGGAAARAAAQSELAALLQNLQGDAALGAQLRAAAGEALDADQAANLREMRRQHRMAQAVPAALVARRERCVGAAMQAWGAAKAGNDWPLFASALSPLLDIVREEANLLGDALSLSPYDALLERHERGLRSTRVQALFGDVAAWLPGLVANALHRQQSRPAPVAAVGPFAPAAQKRLCERVMGLLGFDFDGGRLDTSAHPFSGGVPEDVRLTTRFAEASFLPALLGTMHETGHARYQQNLPREWLGQPLAEPHSAALHEGQALCYERQLAPRPAFAGLLEPLLRDAFGDQPAFEAGNLVSLTTRVRPGLIRVEADELSYPAHVILRVEIESALVAGEIQVADIPAWWDERMQRLLGIDTRGDFSRGPLQDMHWASGMFGYFPAYLLGAMVAAQCFEAITQATPDLDSRIAAGDLECIGGWLRQHVWKQGARLDADALLQAATGRVLDAGALRRHLERRYGDTRTPNAEAIHA